MYGKLRCTYIMCTFIQLDGNLWVRLIADPEHSADEDRFILLGISANARILVVVHAYNESDDVIRIISARKATKTEFKFYTGELKWKKNMIF